jgi:L-aspartate oxidase
VRTIVTEGPARIEELVKWGVHFDQREAKSGHLEFDLTKEGGHSTRACCMPRMPRAVRSRRSSSPPFGAEKHHDLENHYAIDLITTAKLGPRIGRSRARCCMCSNETSGRGGDLPLVIA